MDLDFVIVNNCKVSSIFQTYKNIGCIMAWQQIKEFVAITPTNQTPYACKVELVAMALGISINAMRGLNFK